ncbi:hypothetical protein H490_0104535 [Leucobacter sp. UCD-THU]|uniref:hypothetical protein n=1 Tax=Leucobacter sp. UCD-THU TaxID=1292023 RepID=UPI0003792236|nr:hypothetical protein [Leucobacter sp. UCD-THU]EYT55887.1 hypothetical protein H490_0104535 [Leucobacter sp. UCD-THU]
MSNPDAASEQPQRAAVEPEAEISAQQAIEEALAEPVPVIEETEHEVTLQRTVRYGRVLVGAAALGAIVAMLACLLFPIPEGAEYTMGQVIGFSAIIGAAIGLGVGGLFSLVLGFLAKRGSGVGIAIQRDVR